MSGSGNITVWINSPGGDCVAAAQIYNMLMILLSCRCVIRKSPSLVQREHIAVDEVQVAALLGGDAVEVFQPHMVGDLEKSSFSNIEQQSLEFVKYTLEPWVTRWQRT